MKIDKLGNYYKLNDPDLGIGSSLTAFSVDNPVLRASADGVDCLEVNKDEYVVVMMWGISQSVYDRIVVDGGPTYHCILGMKLKII